MYLCAVNNIVAYGGNRLTGVTEAAADYDATGTFEYKGANGSEYLYDSNGSLIADRSRRAQGGQTPCEPNCADIVKDIFEKGTDVDLQMGISLRPNDNFDNICDNKDDIQVNLYNKMINEKK